LEGTIDRPRIIIPNKHYASTEAGAQHSEQDIGNSALSKTSDCHRYVFTDCFVFIDTPGLADTGGVAKDEQNITRILEAACDCSNLSGLVLVLNGTVARCTINMRTVLDRLAGTLPDGMLGNLIIIFTNCADITCCSFEMEVLRQSLGLVPPPENIFFMQNSLFSQPPHVWANNPAARQRMQEGWDQSMNTVARIVQRIEQLGPCVAAGFQQIRELREKLKLHLVEIQGDIRQMLQVKEALTQNESMRRQLSNNQQQFQNYTATTTITSVVLEDTTYYNTCCSKCGTMCHENCALSETCHVGSNVFNGCYAFSNNTCRECPDHCSSGFHFHARKKPRRVVDSIDTILEDIKVQYDEATAGLAKADQDQVTHQQAMKRLDDAIALRKSEIQDICRGLKARCSKFNMVRELSTIRDTYITQKAASRDHAEVDACDQIIAELNALLQINW
jgi:TolA-binding protein